MKLKVEREAEAIKMFFDKPNDYCAICFKKIGVCKHTRGAR